MLITYTGDIDSPKLNALQQGAAILTDIAFPAETTI